MIVIVPPLAHTALPSTRAAYRLSLIHIYQVFIYTWTEADSHKGSNEIASCVYHQLTNTDMSKYEIVRLDVYKRQD